MSARTRRGLTLSWIALFVLSLLLQYASFVGAQPVLAVHDGVFQLDGNAEDEGAGNDWDSLGSPDASVFITDGANATIFTTGGSKDDLDTTSWQWTDGSVPDKDDILHAYAAVYGDVLYFGADRYANNGDAAIGFWFFKNGLNVNPDGTFSPAHAVGDLFVVSHFENGGATAEIQLYEWVGSGGSDGTLDLIASGQLCTDAPAADQACGIGNEDPETAPWAYTPKSGDPGIFPAFSFFEGGLDLAQVFDDNPPCFSSFLVETRSSQEINAQLKDFVAGSFNTCEPPDIETEASVSSIDLGGGSVTDTATLSGDDGPASGTVTFFVCTPAQVTAGGCPSGGTQVGDPVEVDTSADGGTATSAGYTPTVAGTHCFRAEYTPDDESQYLAGSHTNATTECFEVLEATIGIVKVADPAGPVSAGDSIGFDITVSNTGGGTALDVILTDELPAGIDWDLGATSGDDGGVSCEITGTPGSETLECTDASLGAGESWSVSISGDTDADDCGVISNTAFVETSNDGSGDSTAEVQVDCPDLEIVKEAVADPIFVGDDAEFTITVTNIGDGTAYDVELFDELPAGYDWSVDDTEACEIDGVDLYCDFGDLASGDSVSVTVSANTDTEGSETEDCVEIENVAATLASNEPEDLLENNIDDAAITVTCTSALEIVKSFTGNTGGTDPDLNVPAAEIGDILTYTLEYTGAGPITNAVITDVLPEGLEYVVGTAAGDASFTFAGYDDASRTLTWTAASLPDPANGTVTYDVEVLEAAPEEPQPLVNVATIDSDETDPDSDTKSVAVLAPPLELTPPPTSTVGGETGTSNPGFALMLILLAVAGLTVTIGSLTPVPQAMRRR